MAPPGQANFTVRAVSLVGITVTLIFSLFQLNKVYSVVSPEDRDR